MSARSACSTPRRCALPVKACFTLVAMISGGCAVGPDYQSPQATVPAHWHDSDEASGSRVQSTRPDPAWWRSFNDPQLDSLIARAIAGNLTIRQSVLRIAGARQQQIQAGAAGLPAVEANASARRQQLGLEGILDASGARAQAEQTNTELASGLGSLTEPIHLYQGSFDASWEIDLWGRVRRSVELADAKAQSAIEGRNDALVSLEAEVARTYLQLRGNQSIISTLETQIAVAEQSRTLTLSRQQNGLSPQMDVENAGAQLSSLQAQLPQYQAGARQAMNALAVLIGQPPGQLDSELTTPKPMPAMPAVIPVGIPSTLARRRPDIRRAEAELHAATANIGVSVAQLFPDLSLTGQFGLRNTETDYLTHWSSHFYAFGPQISLPIFQGGRLVSNVRLARVEQANAVLAYRQVVLNALQDVENALVSYRTDKQQVKALENTADSLETAFMLANEGYRQGLSTFINVLDAQRQLAQARQQAASARVKTATDLVSLYKALGGGWEVWHQPAMPDYPLFGPAETLTRNP
ncbi:NodT family efflux transporter outer membrane factor (OMF) lipoprotein [Biostraticola tofi]|uniref:NodT family efflux transporter outer membrane factor (OMF) lipoprotein n=2 Tax=Biostraticola tofi TaxID=466109 RepID=A0A4R3Z2L5_9GAMM|nr:NodT family efflux transporter outer membrane factor (OMF) lipoprotein [Biostraticola tofi]